MAGPVGLRLALLNTDLLCMGSIGTSPHRAPVGRLRGLRLIGGTVLILVILGGVAGLTLLFKHQGERAIAAQRDLANIGLEVQAQDALEWRAISGVELAEVVEPMAESRERVATLLRSARANGLQESDALAIERAAATYADEVDQELDLLAEGDLDEAREHDEEHVDPAFEAVSETLEETAGELDTAGEQARLVSEFGLLGTVVFSLLFVAGLQRRMRVASVTREQERRSEARFRGLVQQSQDLVLVVAPAAHVTYASPSAGAAFGAVVGTSAERLVPLPTGSWLTGEVETGAALLCEWATAHEATRLFEVQINDLRSDATIAGWVLTARDVTEQRRLQQEVEYRALHDSLTGLPNRVLLIDRVSQALAHGRRTGKDQALLLVDLDKFKEINDTLGHRYGDELLKQIGPRLAEVLREGDTVARLGGDEFAILLADVDGPDAALGAAERVRDVLHRPFVVDEVTLDVEASIGVSLAPAHGEDLDELLRSADIAMYVSKEAKSGPVLFAPTDHVAAPNRLTLLGDLRRALDSESELFLHYQPKLALSDERIYGVEALLRWQHPTRGSVPPGDFIGVAEGTGLIMKITQRVLDLSLAQARRWLDQGHEVPIAVNLSPRCLLDTLLPQMVMGMLARHGVPARLLRLEITETAIMADATRALDVLQRLHDAGVHMSIDDFGTGYSSMAYLKRLPVDELKIDRSFVMEMTAQENDAVLVRTAIDLGHNLGMTVVAEGVETQQHVDALRTLGCDIAQGFHYARPMSAEAVGELLAKADSPLAA